MLKLTAVGRIAKDAKTFEYGDMSDRKVGTSFGLIAENYGDKEASYIQCTIWGRDVSEYLLQGNQLIVHGNLSVDVTDNGSSYVKLSVSEFEFGAKKMRRD